MWLGLFLVSFGLRRSVVYVDNQRAPDAPVDRRRVIGDELPFDWFAAWIGGCGVRGFRGLLHAGEECEETGALNWQVESAPSVCVSPRRTQIGERRKLPDGFTVRPAKIRWRVCGEVDVVSRSGERGGLIEKRGGITHPKREIVRRADRRRKSSRQTLQ